MVSLLPKQKKRDKEHRQLKYDVFVSIVSGSLRPTKAEKTPSYGYYRMDFSAFVSERIKVVLILLI
jgi:hypothetical protein